MLSDHTITVRHHMIIIITFLLFICSVSLPQESDFAFEQNYLEALKCLNAKNYSTASSKFEKLLLTDLTEEQKEKCTYYLKQISDIFSNQKKTELTASEKKVEALVAAQIFVLPDTDYDSYFSKIQEMGYNTVILRVFQNPGDRYHFLLKEHPVKSGVYFQTDKAPVVLNILNKVADTAHQKGLKIFAWMTTRELQWDFPGKQEMMETKYNIQSRLMETGKGIDIFNPNAVKYITELYRDLARHNIDGILFQDDLVLRNIEGFGKYASKAFKEKTTIELKPDNLYYFTESSITDYKKPFRLWCKVKAEKIITLVNKISKTVKEVNPDIKIALNVYYDTVLDPENGLYWLSQDVTLWKSNKEIDYFMVMAYHRQIGRELQIDLNSSFQRVLSMPEILKQWITPQERSVIKLQAVDWESGENIPEKELTFLIKQLSTKSHISMALAPYNEDIPVKIMSPKPLSSRNR